MKIVLETKTGVSVFYIGDKHLSDLKKIIEYIIEQEAINGEDSDGITVADFFKEMQEKK